MKRVELGKRLRAGAWVIAFIAFPVSLLANPQGLCGAAPDSFEQSVEIVEDSLRIVLSTDRGSYQVGEPVWMRLEIINLASDSLTIRSQWAPMERFEVYPDSCTSGPCLVWSYPEMIEFDGDLIPLLPDEPQTRCGTWNGLTTLGQPVPPGSYLIRGGFTSVTQGHSLYDFVYPEGGLSIVVELLPPAPVSSTTWGKLKGRWSQGPPRP